MPYFAAGRVVIVTPEEAGAIADTGNLDIAFEREAGLTVVDIDGALFCALRALARARAPEALSLFTRHWAVSERGRNHLVEGDHADLLEGDTLARALAATDALLSECQAHPDRIAAILEAADLPHGMAADDAEAALRSIAGSPAPATVAEATEAFEADFATDHLSTIGLHAWLRAFAAWMRDAQATGQAVVHLAMF
jgi:hypothetical protein